MHTYRDDVVGAQSNVLDTGTTVKVDILLDLRLLAAHGGLVDGHLDMLIVVGDDCKPPQKISTSLPLSQNKYQSNAGPSTLS